MKDNSQIPNLGMAVPPNATPQMINGFARLVEQTFRQFASRGSNSVVSINYYPTEVANLPARSRAGDTMYASDGRKNGEGPGVGTGVLVFFDGTNWIACDSGQTVAA